MTEERDADPAPSEDTEEARGRLQEVLRARREKLEALRWRGVEPFALRFDEPMPLAEIRRRFGDLAPDASTGETVRVAGRIVLLRRQGRLTFATIRDAADDLQLFVARDDLGAGYDLLDLLDLGDIVGATGEVITTKRGELSVRVRELVVLTKALRPLPEKWRGLRDPEARLRRRYLDFATNLDSRRVVQARAQVLKALRRVLDDRGFVEVETPALHGVPGGAVAKPFVTHHLALDIPLYLRIAPELYLKRLLVGGLERVYEIGRNFRNEGISPKYNPEFTMLEVYQAYADYLEMMDLVEALVRECAVAVRGTLAFDHHGTRLDFDTAWRRATLRELVGEAVGR